MTAGIIALALTGVGLVLIVVGVVVSLDDRKKRLAKEQNIAAEGTGSGNFEGLAKLADALRTYPLGMQLIFIGVGLMVAGGGVGGINSVTS